MDARYLTPCLVGAVGLMLLIAPACSMRSVQTGSDSSEGGPLRGFERLQPGQTASEERLSGGTMVAKSQPSERSSQKEAEIRREQAAAATAGLNDVFFAFDSWSLTEEGMQSLARNAEWIKANPNARLKIGGHADERGTQAYNIVLGEKRAKTTRNYLAELGVGVNRLAIVSYGKERPFCKESDESCYQKNRRGQMLLGVSKAAKKTSSAVQ